MEAQNATTDEESKQNYYTVLEGGHETVAKTALTLINAGKKITVRNGNCTDYIEGDDLVLSHGKGFTHFVSDNGDGIVSGTIRDSSRVTVRTE